MSADGLDEEWINCQSANALVNDVRSWTTSISRSRVSTADGLGFTENIDLESMNSLESLLRTVQQLKLKKLLTEEIEKTRFIATGETFSVSECKYEGKVVAIKRIKMISTEDEAHRLHLQRRLQSVLREILIMCHPPLAHNPNIVSLLGYGWDVEEQRLSPFISVEFASGGSLRNHLRDQPQSIRNKLILMGDVGAGLISLHKCGIIHGDLKLDNVNVFPSIDRPSLSIAKVSDFGHSILISSSEKKEAKYYGTVLYNAPEVASQKYRPINADQLHKCDIWAFGLSVWEILADGKVYFQSGLGHDPTRSFPSNTSDTLINNSISLDKKPSETDEKKEFSQFDLSSVKPLALKFLDRMVIPGIGFEKGFLRPLLNGALEVDPMKRISDISRLPIIGFWNKAPGGHSLQTRLATFTLSGDIRYSIFSRDGGPYILWEQQRQLLQDFEATVKSTTPGKSDGSAAFQTMLCYANAFGTSRDMQEAKSFLRKAEESGHFLTQVIGQRILAGLDEESPSAKDEYSQCLARGFELIEKKSKAKGLNVHQGGKVTEFLDYASLRDTFLDESNFSRLDKEDVMSITVVRKGSTEHHTLLEAAIQEEDIPTVDFILEMGMEIPKDSGRLLVQAARRQNMDLVERLIKAGATIYDEDSPGLLHWLFCLETTHLSKLKNQLESICTTADLAHALSHAPAQAITLHPQWPFQIRGTPLATAIAANSIESVKSLLALKADPLASAFAVADGDVSPILTPVHLAIRYHSPEILSLLWAASFGTRYIEPKDVYSNALSDFPIGCALSLMSNAERFAIHGEDHKQRLRDTVYQLPLEILTQTSSEGKNAITQAIDLEDIDTLDAIFARFPELAAMKLSQPGSSNMHTYPIHFAVQIGSNRGTDEALRIVESIMHLDPEAIHRADSSSAKPIHVAAMGSSDHILNYFLDHGCYSQDLDEKSQTPLHYSRSAKVVRTLIERGANINHKDQLGFTPLHAAATRNASEALQALIDAGADVGLSDNGVGSPLHRAIQNKSIHMVQLLLKAGANVNSTDAHGRTPISVAVGTNRSDIVSLLLENNADPFIMDSGGSSAFQLALAAPAINFLTMFKSHPGFADLSHKTKVDLLYFASSSADPESLKEYLRILSSQSSESEAPAFNLDELNIALRKSISVFRGDLMQVLLSSGCQVDYADSEGNTPLLFACQIGRDEGRCSPLSRAFICEKLIEWGADVRAKNAKSITPIFVAQLHKDIPLMASLFDKVLRQGGMDSSTRRSRILSSLKCPSMDNENCKDSKTLIGFEISYVELMREAVEREEWEFIMTCVGGHLISKEELGLVFSSVKFWEAPLDSLDLFRFYCAKGEREFVKKIYQRSKGDKPLPENAGRGDFDRTLNDAAESLQRLLWPELPEKGTKARAKGTPLEDQRH